MFRRSSRLRSHVSAMAVAVPAFALAAALTLSTLGAPASVRADHDPRHDPEARLQFVIRKITMHEDRDWGAGDIKIDARFWEVKAGCPPNYYDAACMKVLDTGGLAEFKANGGDTKEFNAIVLGNDVGIPVHAGRTYGWEIEGTEIDAVVYDELGQLSGHMSAETGWGPLGTYYERGTIPHSLEERAHFSVEYEIRGASLPDLIPTKIELFGSIDPPAGSLDPAVCVEVTNSGPISAGPFEIIVDVDGVAATNGTANAIGLGPAGQVARLCVAPDLPSSGEYRLSVRVDALQHVTEEYETNNLLEQRFVVKSAVPLGVGGPVGQIVVGTIDDPGTTPPRPAPTATSTPSPAQADLTVSAVTVARQAHGSGTCKGDETNYLLIRVRNNGWVAAGQFAVGFSVGGDLKQERVYVQALAAGATIDVTIPTDDLNGGPRAVMVIADGDNQVIEVDETNNAREVTAACD